MRAIWWQLRGELAKLFARGRTSLGFAVLLPVQIGLVALLGRPQIERLVGSMLATQFGPEHGVLSGPTAAFLALSHTILPLGAIFLALVSGDIVSKEVEDGTMRMVLARPVGRIRILLLKFGACALYTLALVFASGLSALAAGLALHGPGELLAHAPVEHLTSALPARVGVARYLLSLPLLGVSLLSVTVLGFALSCFDMKPSSAASLTAALFLADMLLRQVPAFDPFNHLFLSASLSAWLQVFHERIPWAHMARDYTLLVSLDVALFCVAWLRFRTRDFKP